MDKAANNGDGGRQKAKRHNLPRRQEFELAFWLKDADLTGIDSLDKLALRVNKEKGIAASTFTLKNVLAEIGRELPLSKPGRGNGKRENTKEGGAWWALAVAVIDLHRKLREPIPPELQTVVDRTGLGQYMDKRQQP